MSGRLVSWALRLDDLTPTQKLVLVALAEHCNGVNGSAVCWPSMGALVTMTGYTDRAIRKALAEFEARNLIDRKSGDGPGRGSSGADHEDTSACGAIRARARPIDAGICARPRSRSLAPSRRRGLMPQETNRSDTKERGASALRRNPVLAVRAGSTCGAATRMQCSSAC
jgi:hypothetical protein